MTALDEGKYCVTCVISSCFLPFGQSVLNITHCHMPQLTMLVCTMAHGNYCLSIKGYSPILVCPNSSLSFYSYKCSCTKASTNFVSMNFSDLRYITVLTFVTQMHSK